MKHKIKHLLICILLSLIDHLSFGQSNINRIEYYIDSDPGFGLATSVSFTPGINIANLNIPVNPTNLTQGLHNFNIRARNSEGWSLMSTAVFYKPYTLSGTSSPLNVIDKLEYFIDADPGFGLGTNVAISPSTNISNMLIPFDPTSTSGGIHVFNLRARDAGGNWSLLNSFLFFKPYPASAPAPPLPNITYLEYYFDSDPGIGQGIPVTISQGTSISNQVIPVNTSVLESGIHSLNVRAKDANGNWSLVNTTMIFRPYPVNANPNLLSNIVRVEYYVDNDPGYGIATEVPITPGTDLAGLVISLDPEVVGTGVHQINVRALDAEGRWSLVNTSTFNSFAQAISSSILPVSGFNTDVVADVPNDAFGSTTNSFDLSYGVFMAPSYNPSGPSYLPANGVINAFFRPGLTFQLQSYTANNSLRLGSGQTDSLTVTSPVSAQDVYLLGGSGYYSNASTFDVTVTFTDLSAQTFTNQKLDNWYNGIDYAIRGVGRTYIYYNWIENDSLNPRLYTLKLPLSGPNQSKPIKSIHFSNINGLINIMAVSISNSCNGTPAPGNTIASATTVCPNTDFTLTLQNSFFGAGITYQWQRADNSTFTQNVVNLGSSYSQVTSQAAAKYYRCLVTCTTGGAAYSNPVLVNIYAAPTIAITGPNAVCAGSSINLTATGGVSYTWAHTASINATQAISPVYNSTYTVTGTNANGCSKTATKAIVVNALPLVTAANIVGCSSAPLALSGSPAGGVFSIPNPYTGPSTTYTYTYTDGNGCTATSAVANITTYASLTYYADADNDGYGNPQVSQNVCAQPSGYVLNNQDCNDNDSLQHPGQVWYTDFDGDGYGIGTYLMQCTRPPHGYAASELVDVNGDCDDSNPNINPGAQYFTFSGTPNFTNSLVSPQTGNAYSSFNVEVIYYDINNGMPPATFPRVYFDYEGNNSFTDYNDRTIIMTPFDLGDLNTVDGKKYVATVTTLPIGSTYKTSVQTTTNGCTTLIGPFNYPDVLQLPDIEIFANDITFSNPHPAISSPLTVSATIHNESDYAASNFVVHLRNQYDTTLVFPDITVAYLPPHGNYTVSWNITTPNVPAWCPMEVTIDYTNVIAETNELDNSAIRPFINGNYNLPGGIHVYSYVTPSVGYPGSYTTLYGSAYYYGTAVPLTDSSVAGSTVDFTIVETGANYSTYTNSNGNFSYTFPNPMATGIYHIQGTVTDFTLTGSFTNTFELIMPVGNCTLPDLTVDITASNPYGSTISNGSVITLVEGDHLTGNVRVTNAGQTMAGASVLNLSNTGSVPLLGSANIPSLTASAFHNTAFNVVYPTAGYYAFYGNADATGAISECDENNNRGIGVNVLPALPDISPYSGPGGTTYDCLISSVSFTLTNAGGSATGPFNVTVVKKLNGVTIGTETVAVASIPSAIYYPSNYGSFSIPFIPAGEGEYTFEVKCDLPANTVTEFNEGNNIASYVMNILACKPNFTFEGCESFDVTSGNGDYTTGSNITLKGVLQNSGNLAYNGNITIRYQLSGGTQFNEIISVNLVPGASVPVSKIISAPIPGTQSLTLTADPADLIDELSEADNAITNNMCWDFYIDTTSACYWSSYFWNRSFLVNQAAYLAVGIVNPYLYDADTLHVKFEVSGPGLAGWVNLGNAELLNVEQTCFCPILAYLPTSFVFPQLGTYTFRITADPDGKYAECNEGNNVLIRSVNVVNLPDMRVLSQFIAPSLLNPQPGQPVSFNISYENIGYPNPLDQMKLKVLVDNVPFATVNNVNGLVTGDNTTVTIGPSWSSNLPGVHVIRAIIDADNTITELNELNNEATRAIVVGESANLHFKLFTSLTLYPALNTSINVRARVGNSGDLACQGDLQLFYVNNNLDTIQFHTTHISLAAHDSVNLIIPWIVLDNKTTIIGKLVNASVLEYTYDDNTASFELGKMVIVMSSLPACGGNNQGQLNANVIGGEPPFSYFWNTGAFGQFLNAPVGSYSVTVSDATGQTATASGIIIPCPPVTLTTNLFIQGYYSGGGLMTSVLNNEGIVTLPDNVDSVTVELRNTASPYNVIATSTGMLKTNGSLVCFFPSSVNGQSYYLAVKHRNLIETWSAAPVPLSTVCSYSFSNAASQAYGDNQSEVSTGIWAMYSGDLTQDQNIDLLDANLLENDISNFEFGYKATDINGDGNVDLLDSPMLETNINSFIYSIHP